MKFENLLAEWSSFRLATVAYAHGVEELTLEFTQGPLSMGKMEQEFFGAATTLALGNIQRDGGGGAAHLCGEAVPFGLSFLAGSK